jgi:hypothetical protein
MSNKRVLLVVTEGQTDDLFYKRMIAHIKKIGNMDRYPFDSIDFVCAKGIGNLQKKIVNVIRSRLFSVQEYIDADITVVLCYDHDVFEYSQNPPIDREELENDILNLGECTIIKIEARRMIEDFFLHDFEGIRSHLRLKKTYKLKKTGYEGIKQMFKDGGKTYFKGENVDGLIDKLNFDVIFGKMRVYNILWTFAKPLFLRPSK